MRLLVVDDDRALRDVLRRSLSLSGYEVRLAGSGSDALSEVASAVPDAMVLDVGLPDIDGLEVCRLLRRERNRLPILMLTARDAVADRIDGLDAGADDYLAKPFDIDELHARIRALLRRAGGEGDLEGGLSFAELRLDPARHGVAVDGTFVELTRTEYQLLELLMLNPRRVLPHTLIYDRVWGYDFGPTSNALRVYVGYLRRKLEDAGSRPLIQTIRGVGLHAQGAVYLSLRARMALAAGVAVALAVMAVAFSSYEGTRSQLQGQLDQSLHSLTGSVLGNAGLSAEGRPGGPGSGPPGGPGFGPYGGRHSGAAVNPDPDDHDEGLGLDDRPGPAFGGAAGSVTRRPPRRSRLRAAGPAPDPGRLARAGARGPRPRPVLHRHDRPRHPYPRARDGHRLAWGAARRAAADERRQRPLEPGAAARADLRRRNPAGRRARAARVAHGAGADRAVHASDRGDRRQSRADRARAARGPRRGRARASGPHVQPDA